MQKLQEESWQLELIISGFAIFGLFSVFEPLELLFQEAQHNNQPIITQIYVIALISCAILAFNLILHVILRGLWIGALGLRYVSGDIDYEELKYSPKFTKHLKRKIGSFDRYIARLENYCSIIFAIAFLLVFYVLALFFSSMCIVIIANYLLSNDDLGNWRLWLGIPLIIFLSIGMLLVFIDFATQGWLKKKKWLSRFYFPFYWVFSYITFSFIYRPLVYNFLDNKFGRRLSRLLLPLYISLMIFSSFKNHSSNYFNRSLSSNTIIANSSNYEDMLVEKGEFIDKVAIPSKVITNRHLKTFIVLEDFIEEDIFKHNPGLKPEKDKRGIRSEMLVINMAWRKQDSLRREYMKTFNEIYNIKIDTIDYASEFIVGESIKKQRGFETYIDLTNLSKGKHILNVTRERIRKKDTTTVFLERIPFWYYPD